MYILAGVAFIIYMSKCPERCSPGQFDYVGCSHQWWHIIVVVAFYYWHDAGLHFLQYRAQQDYCV
jgi:predicted membrane channel-forming protein YqfA (hemolysin III family)